MPPPSPLVGVYLLVLGDEVIYVGQSREADVRVALHRESLGFGAFDRALLLKLLPEDLDAYEGVLIRCFAPRLNKRAPRPSARELAILLELGLPVHRADQRHHAIAARNPRPGPDDGRRRRGRARRSSP